MQSEASGEIVAHLRARIVAAQRKGRRRLLLGPALGIAVGVTVGYLVMWIIR